MPRAKRPLAEVDSNARRLPATKRTKTKTGKLEKDHESSKKNAAPSELPQSNTVRSEHTTGHKKALEQRQETFEYSKKDNSKLRRFLSERGLSTSGKREVLITRLENSTIDYESFSSEELSGMLKARHVRCADQGSKKVKIQRLRINDKIDRDTGNTEEGVLYGRLALLEDTIVPQFEKSLTENDYDSMTMESLRMLLMARKLPVSGDKSMRIARLQASDGPRQKISENARNEQDSRRAALERKIGHALPSANAVLLHEEQQRSEDTRILQALPQKQDVEPSSSSIPKCEYNWRDSHWASRTERELKDICRRREMPGYGTKAAMIKWLETGELDYQDLDVSSLEDKCKARGIKGMSKATKKDLIRMLENYDERGGTLLKEM